MRVTFVSCATEPWGAERSMVLIAQYILERQCEIRLLCRSTAVAELWRQNGLEEATIIEVSSRSRVGILVEFLQRIRRVDTGHVVVIFSLDLMPLGLILRLARHRSCFIFDLHDCPEKRLTRFFIGILSYGYDRVICISRFAGELVPKRLAVYVNRPICARPAAVEPDNMLFHVGVIGRLDPLKRIELAIDACSKLGDGIVLHVRGANFTSDGSYPAGLRKLGLSRLGQRFRMDGVVDNTRVMDGLHAVVVANDHEPSGRTVGEAQAAGVPVIVPDRGGAVEYVTAGMTGSVFKSGDSESLAAAIDELRHSAYRRFEMSRAARVYVGEHRSPAVVGKAYFESIVGAWVNYR